MNHKASIYSNPLIPPGLYYCKLLDIHLDTSDQPFIWTCLATGPNYGDFSNIKLNSILYNSLKSEELVAKLQATFRISDLNDPESCAEALGRWGCISVFPREWQCQEFSCVGFVRQNQGMRVTAGMLERREREGEEWAERQF
jgi:hypothetical protein